MGLISRVFLVLFFFLSMGFSQGIPVIAGGQIETGVGTMPQGKIGAGLVRVTPFLGAWIPGLGYGKVGLSYWESSRTDTSGVEQSWEERDLSIQLGASYGTPDRPYLIGSFTKAKQLSELGDSDWEEWGLGLGAFFHLGGASALVFEVENRWIGSHYDPVREEETAGTRIQMNIGFIVYFL
jgi:hypothetical protein